MKEINEFQSQNGNIKYTTKELVQALHVKIDNALDKQESRCLRRKGELVKMVVGTTSICITLIGALASYVFYGGK